MRCAKDGPPPTQVTDVRTFHSLVVQGVLGSSTNLHDSSYYSHHPIGNIDNTRRYSSLERLVEEGIAILLVFLTSSPPHPDYLIGFGRGTPPPPHTTKGHRPWSVMFFLKNNRPERTHFSGTTFLTETRGPRFQTSFPTHRPRTDSLGANQRSKRTTIRRGRIDNFLEKTRRFQMF